MDILLISKMVTLQKNELLENILKMLSCFHLLQVDYLKALLVIATAEKVRATCDNHEQEMLQWYEVVLEIHRVLNSYHYLYRNK